MSRIASFLDIGTDSPKLGQDQLTPGATAGQCPTTGSILSAADKSYPRVNWYLLSILSPSTDHVGLSMTKQKIRIKSALLFLSARQSIPKKLAEMACPGAGPPVVLVLVLARARGPRQLALRLHGPGLVKGIVAECGLHLPCGHLPGTTRGSPVLTDFSSIPDCTQSPSCLIFSVLHL